MILPEDPNTYRRLWVGDISSTGEIRAKFTGRAHRTLGYNNLTWRYNPSTRLIYWWKAASTRQKDAVQAFIEQQGHRVAGHTSVKTRELWKECHLNKGDMGGPY